MACRAPEAVGLNGLILGGLKNHMGPLAAANIHSVLVVRRGTLVYEQYFVGEDQCFGESLGSIEFCSHKKHHLRSVTKSVTSLRVGIAIDRKLIKGVDTPLFDYFPEYADLCTPERDGILLRHLLTVSVKLSWIRTVLALTLGIAERMFQSRDPYGFTLESALVTPPGGVFCYSSGGSELVGVVIRKAAKQPIEDLRVTFCSVRSASRISGRPVAQW
jgi:CubicO group peptidase (beta-lactamase class C family)